MDEVRDSEYSWDFCEHHLDELDQCVHAKTYDAFASLGLIPARAIATIIMNDVRESQGQCFGEGVMGPLDRCVRAKVQDALKALGYLPVSLTPGTDDDGSDHDESEGGGSDNQESAVEESPNNNESANTFYTALTTQ